MGLEGEEDLRKRFNAGDHVRPCSHLYAHWMTAKENRMETYWEKSQFIDTLWYAACPMCRSDAIQRNIKLWVIVEEQRRPN